MKFRQNELNACAVTQEEVEERLAYLSKTLAPSVVAEIANRTDLDICTIVMLFNRARLVERLLPKPGFNRVRRDILADPKPSLYQPHGQWFQLRVGSLLTSAGEDISFEQTLDGSRGLKDIVLRNGMVVVECKNFVLGEKLKSSVNKWLNFGVLPATNPESPKAFDKKVGFLGFLPFHSCGEMDEDGIVWITVNEYERFFSNALESKYGQMVEGVCNLIACTVDQITTDVEKLRQPIVDLLVSNRFDRISGLLLIQDVGISEKEHKMKGLLRFAVSVVENPTADVRIPPGLIENIFALTQP